MFLKKYLHLLLISSLMMSAHANQSSVADHLKAFCKGGGSVLGGALVGGWIGSKKNNELTGIIGGGLAAMAIDYYSWGGKDDPCAKTRQLGYAAALLLAAKGYDIGMKRALQPRQQGQDAVYADTDAMMQKHSGSDRNACVQLKLVYFARKKNNQILDVMSKESIHYALQPSSITEAVGCIDSIYPIMVAYMSGHKILIDDPLAARQISDRLQIINKKHRPIGHLTPIKNLDKNSMLYSDTNTIKEKWGVDSYNAVRMKVIYFANKKNNQSCWKHANDRQNINLSENTNSLRRDAQAPIVYPIDEQKFTKAIDSIDCIDSVLAARIGNDIILLDEPVAASYIADIWQRATGRQHGNLIEGRSYMISPHNRGSP